MKTKALISFAVTAKLICVFIFAYEKSWFSHNEALICWINVAEKNYNDSEFSDCLAIGVDQDQYSKEV